MNQSFGATGCRLLQKVVDDVLATKKFFVWRVQIFNESHFSFNLGSSYICPNDYVCGPKGNHLDLIRWIGNHCCFSSLSNLHGSVQCDSIFIMAMKTELLISDVNLELRCWEFVECPVPFIEGPPEFIMTSSEPLTLRLRSNGSSELCCLSLFPLCSSFSGRIAFSICNRLAECIIE